MEQLEMTLDAEAKFLSSNGYKFVSMSPRMEGWLGKLVLEKAKDAENEPAAASWDGKPIPRNCLPPVSRPAEEVSGHQLLILRTLLEKSKKRADIVKDLGLPANSISSALQTLKKRKLICIPRKLKRQGWNGSPVYVYAISEAGRRAVEAME